MIEIIVMAVMAITLMRMGIKYHFSPYQVFLKHESYRAGKTTDNLTAGNTYPCTVIYVGRWRRSNPVIVARLFAHDLKSNDEKLIDAVTEARQVAIRLNSAIGKQSKQLIR